MTPDLAEELRQQVFLSNYRSREQRTLRVLAMIILVAKHSLRGSLLFLPLYLVLAVAAFQPGVTDYLVYFLLLLPGLGWWFVVQVRGALKDYEQVVEGKLLKRADLRQLSTRDD